MDVVIVGFDFSFQEDDDGGYSDVVVAREGLRRVMVV